MMHCKYHPLQRASFACDACKISHCDDCVAPPDRQTNVPCYFCKRPLTSMGTGNQAEPFWRRLQDAFRYPLNFHSLSIIIGVALLSAVTGFLGIIGVFLLIALIGAMLKYSFICLEHTAHGEMEAPDIGDAYEGGFLVMLKLIAIVIVMSVSIGAIAYYVNSSLATLLGFCAVLAFPATLIRFAQDESISTAINPLGVLQLIAAIGLPYGLLIAFIMIMMGSVGVINSLIGENFAYLSGILQSVVSNYYIVVTFHIMGYMLYQYQDKLGYSARSDAHDLVSRRSEISSKLAKIDVYVKEGQYEQATKDFLHAIAAHPNEQPLLKRGLNFSIAIKDVTLLTKITDAYMEYLVQNNDLSNAVSVFTQTCSLLPNYLPPSPQARLLLANHYNNRGNFKTAFRLCCGMQ
ncbi:MAG: hypothetical protein ACI93R_003909, partial [Flavobacteriales bacterium]